MDNFNRYLTISDVEEKWGLYVTSLGFNSFGPKQRYPLAGKHPQSHLFTWERGRRLNGHYLVFISKGQGVFQTETINSCKISAGTGFFLFPNVWHRYKPDKNIGWDEYWVGFDGYYARQLMASGFFSPENCIIQFNLTEEIQVLFKKMIDSVKSASAGYHQLVSGLVLQLLSAAYYTTEFESKTAVGNNLYISRAKFIMQESIERGVNLKQIAGRLAVSYSKFRKDFKNVTGLSPNQYLLQLRIRKAGELLRSSTLSISEIALRTGFDSVYYFSRYFKKNMGTAPSSYRENSNNQRGRSKFPRVPSS